MALKTLRCCGDTSLLEQRGTLRPYTPPTTPKNTCLLGGLSAIHTTRRRRAQGLMWGAMGPFLLAAAMVVVVVMAVVFVLRLLKNAIKTLKLVICQQKCLFITMYCKTYYDSRNAN